MPSSMLALASPQHPEPLLSSGLLSVSTQSSVKATRVKVTLTPESPCNCHPTMQSKALCKLPFLSSSSRKQDFKQQHSVWKQGCFSSSYSYKTKSVFWFLATTLNYFHSTKGLGKRMARLLQSTLSFNFTCRKSFVSDTDTCKYSVLTLDAKKLEGLKQSQRANQKRTS